MATESQKIAIIGTGISGLSAAYLLHSHHDITVYEKNDYIGGHARARQIQHGDANIVVDTGFIVFNHRNYPHLTALFKHLNVSTQKSVMSFGVMSEADSLEWGAENISALFGQRSNLCRPAFYRFLFDILRFNHQAKQKVHTNPQMTLGELLQVLHLGEWFQRYYILPMGGAIWSCSLNAINNFPAKFFVDFFDAHGLLTITDQPQWYTVTGGSNAYITRLTHSFKNKICLSREVDAVTRTAGKVQITDIYGQKEEYDEVIFASHANETLAMLKDATKEETVALSAFRYQMNTAVLHKYEGIMPRHHKCWSSWIYHDTRETEPGPIAVTYWMNHLQDIDKKYPVFVTLNPRTPIPESDVFERHLFAHPIYDPSSVAAQSLFPALQGQRNTWFCGAHHRNGFHEDGLASALNVAMRMGITPPWQ